MNVQGKMQIYALPKVTGYQIEVSSTRQELNALSNLYLQSFFKWNSRFPFTSMWTNNHCKIEHDKFYLLLPLVAVSAKIKDQEHIQTKSLSWVWEVKVSSIKSNALAYQAVDSHSKQFSLAAVKTVSAFKRRVGMMTAEWKFTDKIRYFRQKMGISMRKLRSVEILGENILNRILNRTSRFGTGDRKSKLS